ncbi:hypothetical protein QFC20_001951 [Naganishia adeliensis]|uniref:Uncharacterized protein n=1 Tax=Naganishia adeliensis TaxID=92952 RepID=A0ACC2WQU8_9TREE|nr:hypothetical protein QFC20_001951 [Naganishia adeliensis]
MEGPVCRSRPAPAPNTANLTLADRVANYNKLTMPPAYCYRLHATQVHPTGAMPTNSLASRMLEMVFWACEKGHELKRAMHVKSFGAEQLLPSAKLPRFIYATFINSGLKISTSCPVPSIYSRTLEDKSSKPHLLNSTGSKSYRLRRPTLPSRALQIE